MSFINIVKKDSIPKYLFCTFAILSVISYIIFIYPPMDDLYGIFALTIPWINGLIGLGITYQVVKRKKSFAARTIGVGVSLVVYGIFFVLGFIPTIILILLREP